MAGRLLDRRDGGGRRLPESFAESEITSELPAVGTIRFKGAVPDGVKEMMAGLPDSVAVVLEPGVGPSAMERAEMIIETRLAVSSSDLVDVVVSRYDREAGVVRVAATLSVPTGTATRSAAADQILADLPVVIRENMSLVLRDVKVSVDDGRNGGGRLEKRGDGGLACTSGFNVRAASGTTGVATAGHCPNSLTHENRSGQAEWSLDYRAGHEGAWGDFQWHTSTSFEPDNFYYNNSLNTRDVSAVANPSLNQILCRYGHRTGQECDTVRDLSVCKSWDGHFTCRLVQMNNDEANGGDSGGPWYNASGSGRTAYGFHHGSADGRDVFSRVTSIDNALNVHVRTS